MSDKSDALQHQWKSVTIVRQWVVWPNVVGIPRFACLASTTQSFFAPPQPNAGLIEANQEAAMKGPRKEKRSDPRSAGVWADDIAERLKPYVSATCDGFFDSFDHTTTGNNRTHPLMLGKLAQILWGIDGIRSVGIDARLNRGKGLKFQPDLVAFNSADHPILAVDYESPNSSDARVPVKDILVYCKWSANSDDAMPYLIITTLPDARCDAWELRYTAPGKYNYDFRDQAEKIRRNPFRFWYAYYKRETRECDVGNVAMLNVSGKEISKPLLK